MYELKQPVELTDAELDAVSAGAQSANGNLVNVQVDNVLNNTLNHNNVEVGVSIAALGSNAFTQL